MANNSLNSDISQITSNKLLPVHKRFNLIFERGEGAYLFTPDSKKYLDFGAGIAVNVLGHCHPALVSALTNQAKKMWHISNIYNSNALNCYAEDIVTASKFANYVFFCNSGAEAIECVIKTIRRYFYSNKQSQKNRIITFSGAFHGRTIATISAAAKAKYLEGFTPKLEGFDNVEFNNIEAVKQAITPETAGILIEPIQGEEGIRVANYNFLQQLRKLADEHQLILAFDEVQCGMARTGKLFASHYFNITPDIVATAKAIGGGFPLGACLVREEFATGMTFGVHGTTYGGNPLAMAVANAVLNIIGKDNFLQEVTRIGVILKDKLEQIALEFPKIIAEIRGVGLMLGICFQPQFESLKMVEKLIEFQLLTVPAGENVVRILPPLIITEEQVEEAIFKIRQMLQNLQDENCNCK